MYDIPEQLEGGEVYWLKDIDGEVIFHEPPDDLDDDDEPWETNFDQYCNDWEGYTGSM